MQEEELTSADEVTLLETLFERVTSSKEEESTAAADGILSETFQQLRPKGLCRYVAETQEAGCQWGPQSNNSSFFQRFVTTPWELNPRQKW